MSDLLFRKDKPNLNDLIIGLERAQDHAPSMPFVIEYLVPDDLGMEITKYLSLQEIPLTHTDGENLVLSTHMHSNLPVSTVECVLKYVLPYKGNSYKLKVDILKPSPRLGAGPGVLTTNKKDVDLAICRHGLMFSISISEQNLMKLPPLHLAAENGDVQLVNDLIKSKEDISLKLDNGATALHFAARNGNLEIIRMLANSDKSLVHSTHADGSTALHWAARYGKLEAVKLLIELGSDISRKGIYTPLEEAEISDHIEVVNAIKERLN